MKDSFSGLTSIYCFSDLEGCYPTGVTEIVDKCKKNPATGVVFIGDAPDRGEQSITLLKEFAALPEERSILVCGNRDLNKIRLGHECWIEAIAEKLDQKTSMVDMLSFINDNNSDKLTFTLDADFLGHTIARKGIFAGNVNEVFLDDHMRIPQIYSKTMGSGNQVQYFANEFNTLFGNLIKPYKFKYDTNPKDNKTLHLFIAMMNMVMGFVWPKNILHTDFSEYNGLYVKYLMKCVLIETFKFQDKLCFVTHSGIPYKGDNFVISETLGQLPAVEKNASGKSTTKLKISSIKNRISVINQKFKDFLELNFVGKVRTNTQVPTNAKYSQTSFVKYFEFLTRKAKNASIDFYTLMSAASGEGNVDIHVMDDKVNSELSPIVTSVSIDKGPWYFKENKKGLAKFLNAEILTGINSVFNISGHQPVGLLPEIEDVVETGSSITTYHVRLDISKAEDLNKSDVDAWTCIYFEKDSVRVCGRLQGIAMPISTNTIPEVNKDFPFNFTSPTNLKPQIYTRDEDYNLTLSDYLKFRTTQEYTVQGSEERLVRPLYAVDEKGPWFGQVAWNKVAIGGASGGGSKKVITSRRKTSKKVPKKTSQTHVGRDKVARVVYELDGKRYVKKKTKNTNTFSYRPIK